MIGFLLEHTPSELNIAHRLNLQSKNFMDEQAPRRDIYPLGRGYQGSAQKFLPVAFRANILCTCSDAARPLGVAFLTRYHYVRFGFDQYHNLGGPLAV